MKSKLLLLLLVSCIYQKSVSIEINTTSKIAAMVVVSRLLTYASSKFNDDEDKRDIYLKCIACGNLLSTFDRAINLEPKLKQWTCDTLINSIALYLCNYYAEHGVRGMKSFASKFENFFKGNVNKICCDNCKKEVVKRSEPEFSKRDISEILFSNIFNDNFTGKFTMYLLMFSGIKFGLSKLLKPLSLNA